MGRPAVGRADLLRCLHAEGAEALAAMAGLAGYRRVPRVRSVRSSAAPPVPGPARAAPVSPTEVRTAFAPAVVPESATQAVGGLPFYRVVDYQPIERALPLGERPDWYHAATPFEPGELLPQRVPQPLPDPLIPWPRLWPFLRAALGDWTECREPDLARLIDLIAQARAPRRLPRRRLHRWAPACQLLLDLSPRLIPFHGDYWRLLPALGRLRGHLGLDLYVLTDGPEGGFRRPGDPTPVAYRAPEPGVPLLILGDLGCLGEPADRAAWRGLGRGLRRAGVSPIALMPCPPRLWDPRLAGLYWPVTWDRAHRLPRRPAGPRPWPAARAEPADDPGAARLLDLLAPAVRLEPALLRALRQCLPGAALDVGAEAAAWVHPDVEPTAFALTWRGQEAVERRRSAYRALPETDRHLAGALIRRHHAHLPGSVRAEEEGNLAQLGGGAPDRDASAALSDYLARTLRTFDQADPTRHAALTAWAARMGTRQHADAWGTDPRRAALWLLAHRRELHHESCPLPPGLDLSIADWVLATGGGPRRARLVQRGGNLFAEVGPPGPAVAADPVLGSPLADLWLTETPVQYTGFDDPERTFSVPLNRGDPLPLTGSGIVLSGPTAAIRIEAMTRPGWACAIGRDEQGLWAEFVFKGVTQRLRWLWPGEFTMGSPADEPQRLDNEQQHQVLLSRGLWLADTACTQALWEAVMGENPSQFKGPERPVEQVDWEQVQAFIGRLNAAVPGLDLRLPTESEWEYGCRAGTDTPFSFGPTITTDQVNYDGDFPYGDGPKGVDRKQTVEVKGLPCNVWGFYQMHGNVWEWCQDWYEDYPEGTAIDPPGAATGQWRVARGGGWFDPAWGCRSAQRSRWVPASRSDWLGFRLARGP